MTTDPLDQLRLQAEALTKVRDAFKASVLKETEQQERAINAEAQLKAQEEAIATLRALRAEWLERARQQRALVHRGESVNPAAMTGMADAREDCADELEIAFRETRGEFAPKREADAPPTTSRKTNGEDLARMDNLTPIGSATKSSSVAPEGGAEPQLPSMDALELSDALLIRATCVEKNAGGTWSWEVPATVAMMREAAIQLRELHGRLDVQRSSPVRSRAGEPT